jgi:hypothetical protein
MDTYLIVALVVAAILLLGAWRMRRKGRGSDAAMAEDRIDTLAGWPPEATRILRTGERIAYSTLKLALPGYMILAQVPIARFINVPKRNSYAEWMRRLGSQCVDFVFCDVTSQVVAVIDVRAPPAQISERLRRRHDRLARSLKAAGIPVHVWTEGELPSVEAVRTRIVPSIPALPADVASRKSSAVASAALARARVPFEDTDGGLGYEGPMEVIEMPEPPASTWFDELDSESSTLPPREMRKNA